MSILAFLTALCDSGRVRVPPLEVAPSGKDLACPEDLDQIAHLLQEIDIEARRELAGEPPALALPATHWAALMLYRASQFFVYREVDAPIVQHVLSQPCPLPPSPEVCYSVDLLFGHLPELWSLARGLSEDDVLTLGLARLAREWPLSSVGIPDTAPIDISPFIDHLSLRWLYVDRILERNDTSRLDDPRIAQAVGQAIGIHEALSPTISAALKEQTAHERA